MVAELLHRGAAAMGFERLRIAPGFQDGELIGPIDLLEHLVAQVSGFLAARRGDPPKQIAASAHSPDGATSI